MNQKEHTISNLNALAALIHGNAKDKGFHRKPWEVWFPEQMLNLIGETTEMNDAHRAGKLWAPCDKPIGLNCFEEECVDGIIRAMDMFERARSEEGRVRPLTIGEAIYLKHEYNRTRPYMHGKKS